MIILEFVAEFLRNYAMTLATFALVYYTARLHSATKKYADITEKMFKETERQITAMYELVNSINQVPTGIERAIKPLTQKAREEMAEKRSEKLTEAQSKINRGR